MLLRAVPVTGLVAVLLAGCTGEPPPTAGPAPSPTSEGPAAAGSDVDRAIQRVLDRRARAVLAGDRRAFLQSVAPGPGKAAQLAWFDRVSGLPLAHASFELGLEDVSVEDPRRYDAEVEEQLQLDGFDAEPVPTVHDFVFRESRGRWRVASDHFDRSQITEAPWDIPGTSVGFGDGVAVVTDRKASPRRAELVAATEDAVRHVREHVPRGLDSVVVLAFSDTAAFAAEGLDTREIDLIGGLAFPVRGPDQQVTGSRVLVAPSMLDRPALDIRVLLRHELTHVALRKLEGPVWMTEGIATYTAWREEPQRFLATSVVREARRGIDAMPPDGAFHATDWSHSYGVAWWANEWLARKEGPQEPYRLLAALDRAGATRYDDVDRILRKRYGRTADRIAAAAGELIVDTFPR